MFQIYIEQPQTQLSLSDYIHLQNLLAQEQAEREHRLLQEYKKQQEQRRIEKAMHKLQVLTELRRRRLLEEQAVEAYYEAKKQARKRQLLEREQRILLRQQQEQYYAALRQKKQQELQDQYRIWAFAQKSADNVNPNQVLAASQKIEKEEEPEEEEEDDEVYQEQLAALVKLIFGVQECESETKEHVNSQQKQVDPEEKVEQEDDEELSEADQEEEEPEQDFNNEGQELSEEEPEISEVAENKELIETQDKVMTLDDFVEYIHNKAQSLYDDQEESGEDAMEEDALMEEDNILLAMENIDNNEAMDEDLPSDFEHLQGNTTETDEDVQVPSLVKSNNIHVLVNDILAKTETGEEFTQFPDEDPVKIAKYDALSRIEHELDEIRRKHEEHVLNATLDFSKVLNDERPASPDRLIAATTAENRELLGYEDQVMKILLKLDMIDSDGDESIRNERKSLVKRAEDVLDRLDEFKLREWEKVSCSSNSSVDEEL